MKNDIIKFNSLILVLIFILLYLSLIVGFYFNEDSTGGAFLDYRGQKGVSEAFAINFNNTFLNYDNFATRHSPVLIVFLSFFEEINLSDNLIRIIHLHILLVLPFIFYLILIEKFKYIEKKYLLLIVGLVFLSPTFRSLSIWPDSRLLGLSIFSLSILFYLFFLRSNQLKYCFFNIIFCAFSAYISPNFSVFSIYFFYFFCKKYGYFSRELIYIILTNILLSLPALYYLFVLDVNFLTKTAAITEKKNFIFFNNIANQILIIPSIIFFYFLPFVLTNILNRSSPPGCASHRRRVWSGALRRSVAPTYCELERFRSRNRRHEPSLHGGFCRFLMCRRNNSKLLNTMTVVDHFFPGEVDLINSKFQKKRCAS